MYLRRAPKRMQTRPDQSFHMNLLLIVPNPLSAVFRYIIGVPRIDHKLRCRLHV